MRYSFLSLGGGSLLALGLLLLGQPWLPLAGVAPRERTQPAAAPGCGAVQRLAKVLCLTEAFKATLTPAQLARVQLPYSKADAVRWSNFPQRFSRPQRVGISLGELSAPQLAAAKALMASVLAQGVPNEGYDELEGELAADTYLGVATKQTDTFGAGNYYLALLGEPSLSGQWELQYGGHHYAFANTYKAGRVVGVTPVFRGIEPMAAVTANGRTYQAMAQEKQAFAALLASLNNSQQVGTRLTGSFHDVLLGPGQDEKFPTTRQGIKVGSLSAAQQQLVQQALWRYVNDLDPATAAPVLAAYTAQLPETYLAYAGGGTMGQAGDYVRLDGPRLWLEYSAQESRDFPGTVHPHSVWRDRLSDYGGN